MPASPTISVWPANTASTAGHSDDLHPNTASKNVNVLATELIRVVESKSRMATLKAVVESRDQLNPSVRHDLIRALRSAAKELNESAKALEQDRPTLSAPSGKAHQRIVLELVTASSDPLLDEKHKMAAHLSQAVVREITREEANPLILQYEYLGNAGSARIFYGLFAGPHLACVVAFGSTAGTKVAESVCGKEHASKVIELVRGCRTPWAHEHSASKLIAKACKLLAQEHGKNLVVAYADPAGGEIGTIYSAVNAYYTGMTNGTEKYRTEDGRVRDAREVHGLTRDRRNGQLTYKRSRAEQKAILIEQGARFFKGSPKYRFVLFAGDKRIKRLLRKALRWDVLPYPKRDVTSLATPTSTC
jgi:hypothetical protein